MKVRGSRSSSEGSQPLYVCYKSEGASLCICAIKVREIRWIQKILKSRLFSPCMSGKRTLCSREKLQERKDVTCRKDRDFLGKTEVGASSFS